MKISPKTLSDLDFQQIKDAVIMHCKSNLAQKKAIAMQPIENPKRLLAELYFVNEFLGSFDSQNYFPTLEFEEITEEIKLLNIEGSFLEASSCLKLKKLTQTAIDAIQFVAQFKEYYATLIILTSKVPVNKDIIRKINKVFNKYGEIKDDATPELAEIRLKISTQQKSISEQFRKELKKYGSQDWLDAIQESVIDEKRVLAVKPAYRKRIEGVVLGQSKTGSIIFMEPDSMVRLNRGLQQLRDDEREETIKILRILTDELREDIELFAKYQSLLAHLDFVRAKAMFADQIEACLPIISDEKIIKLRDAYHPILLMRNEEEEIETIPQNIELNEKQRIISISGPNAGGKSISLKTIGLLQVMLQSGLLIPVHPQSEIGFFNCILTDIGDNQSIENHLSTYSYRLKQMRDFLRVADENTLFLIDEFGTGSDPELGGALAEVFIEELYERGSYGILTTHYTNIKLVIEELPNAINACMLFNEKTLEPLYKLEIGQAGSSFTFEVAQKNGIPFSLINRAKKKVEKDTVRLDKTMVKLQQEKFRLEKSKQKIEDIEQKVSEKKERLTAVNERIEEKLLQYQEAFDRNQKHIALGKKVDALAERYFYNKQKKDLMREVLKIVEMENAKREAQTKKQQEQRQKLVKKVDQELETKIEVIREKRQNNEAYEKELEAKAKEKFLKNLSIGDRVKVGDGASAGIIEKIEKKHAFINFGYATIKADLKDLRKV